MPELVCDMMSYNQEFKAHIFSKVQIKDKMIASEKHQELKKYHDLNLATLDYLTTTIKIKTNEFDSVQYYKSLKTLVIESFEKGRLTKLKQYFRDLTEMFRETADFEFTNFIMETTGYEINLHEKFEKRILKILERQKIITTKEYRDVLVKVDYLCQSKTQDLNQINELNAMLIKFDQNIKK